MGLVLTAGERRRVRVETLGPVKVNLDDLQDLKTLMAERTRESVQVSVGRYFADDVFDLIDASDTDLRSVQLAVPSKSLTVTLTPDGASVVCDSRDQGLLDLVEDVADFVNARPIPRSIVYPWPLIFLLLATWLMISGASVSLAASGSDHIGYATGAIITAVTISYLYYLPRSHKHRGAVEVIPLRRHEIRRRGFESRNALASGIIGAIFGAAIGAAATIAAVYLN
ncbi:hypothetical protein ACQSMD_05410 [Streptomyces flavovirens]|uniref:hypothetical protein n=1 Tax=Streptomyces flavovirens TaxID=52258 RepID=UPI003D0E5289